MLSNQARGPCPWSPNLTMFTNLPFFPHQASAQAAQVDAIYFFMVAVTAFFSLLIAALVVVFAVKYRRKSDDEIGVAIHGSLALELLWTFIPLGIAMVMFAWGAKVFFDLYRPPVGAMEIFVVGKQWMWKAQHAERAARDQRAARAHRPPGEARDGLGGRHPQLLHSGVSREGGRDSRDATTRCGSRPPSPGGITCSARSTAARSTPA